MWVVAATEFRRLLRSGRLLILIVLTLLLGLLATVGTVWWWANELSSPAEMDWSSGQVVAREWPLGLRLTWAALVLLLPVCLVAMPMLTADMIAGEREDGTLEMLELTALQPRELVLGKFLAAAAAILMLALSTLPFVLIADLAGGPSLWGTLAFIGAAVLYCLPFAAVGIGRSVRSPTRAEAMKGAFRDMLLWPVIGLGIGMGGGIFVAILLGLLNWFTTSSRLGFWVTHVLTFPAGFVWTDIFQAIGKTPWFWLAVPVAITIHCLRQAWLTAAWLEPTRTQEQVQARRRARAAQEAAGLLGARPPAPGAPWAPPRVPTPQEQRAIEMRTPWATMAQRLRNPIEVLAALHKRDAAWYFAIFGWFVPLLIVGSPVLFSEGLIRERSVFPSLGALFWVGLMVAYACMVTPTVVTAEREGGTLDSLRMTRLGPADIIWGKLKPRWLELGVLYLGGAVFMSIFTTFGSLTLPSLVLLWVSAPVYVAAYAGVGALASVWSRRSTHAILAVWALLAVPAMLSLAMIGIAGAVGHWGLLPLSPPLTVFRCLVFRLPDPTGPSLWLPHLEAYAVWGLSIVIHVVLAAICWWTALRRFDRWLFENQDRGR